MLSFLQRVLKLGSVITVEAMVATQPLMASYLLLTTFGFENLTNSMTKGLIQVRITHFLLGQPG
jgi:hypothetical protein